MKKSWQEFQADKIKLPNVVGYAFKEYERRKRWFESLSKEEQEKFIKDRMKYYGRADL